MEFKEIKRRALWQTLSEIHTGVTLSRAEENAFADYEELVAYDDVQPVLATLAKLPNTSIRILTNADEQSVHNTLDKSPHLSALEPTLNLKRKIVSPNAISTPARSERIGKYLPANEMYEALWSNPVMKERKRQVWLISRSHIDIAGARALGMSTIWVNRSGIAWPDFLGFDGTAFEAPDIIVRNLSEVEGCLRDRRVGAPTVD